MHIPDTDQRRFQGRSLSLIMSQRLQPIQAIGCVLLNYLEARRQGYDIMRAPVVVRPARFIGDRLYFGGQVLAIGA